MIIPPRRLTWMARLLTVLGLLVFLLICTSCDEDLFICKPGAVREDPDNNKRWFVCNRNGTKEKPVEGTKPKEWSWN